jgi:hypothetical protein
MRLAPFKFEAHPTLAPLRHYSCSNEREFSSQIDHKAAAYRKRCGKPRVN